MKTFRIQQRAPIAAPKRTHSRRVLLGVTATTYLALCIWLGPRVAFSLIVVSAIGGVWFLACRRWPIFAVFTLGFLRGLLRR